MRIIVTPILFLISCSSAVPGWIQDIRSSDYSQVELREYPYFNEITKEKEVGISELRKEVEKYIYVLEEILYHFFPQEENKLRFRYRFTSMDRENKTIIYNYFASIDNPRIYAGYMCQLVFSLDSREIKKVYLKKIPLER